MRAILICGLAAAGATLWAGEIRREGNYWVETDSGAEALGPARRLKISADGNLTMAGVAEDRLSYTVVRRVKARSEADARRALEGLRTRMVRQGEWAVLSIPSSESSEINVHIPRRVEEVSVGLPSGSIEANDLAGVLRCSTGAGGIKADRIGGDLEARTGGGQILLGTIHGTAHCISGGGPIKGQNVRGEAFFETGGGVIELQEAGSVRASTGAGGIRVGRSRGPVSVVTAGGPIEIGESLGRVIARNQGGPIQIGTAAGVECETANGAIRLSNVRGEVRASTLAGSIVARLISGFSESFLSTTNGDIIVVIPSNVAVTVRAESEGMRRIISEFPAIAVRYRKGAAVAEGELNGGGPILRISGAGGTIFIKKQN